MSDERKVEKKKKFFTKEVRFRSGDVETVPNVPNIIKFCIGIILFILIIFLCWPLKIVDRTERGILKTFGQVQERVLEPGLHFKAPFAQRIETYDITPTTVAVKIPVGEDGALSRDRQTLGIGGSYNWRYDETRIIEIAKRFSSSATLTRQTNDIINTAIRNTVGRYDIANIVIEQVAISNEARNLAMTMLANAQIPVEIMVLNLNNWDWSDGYDAMIQRTIEEQQNALKAEAELKRVEQETQQERIRAKATADANIASAEGRLRTAELDAQARIVEANSISEANRIKSQPAAMEFQRAQWNYEIAMERAKKLAPGVEVPMYIPLNPAGGVVTLPGR